MTNSQVSIHILGSKSVDLRQAESLGFLVESTEFCLLFDAGPYAAAGLNKIEFLCSSLDAIFISHWHLDHWLGVPWIANTSMFESYFDPSIRRKHPMVVIDPNEDQLRQKLLLEEFGDDICFTTPSSLAMKSLRNEISLRVIEVPHTRRCYGARLQIGAKTICYLPDVGGVDRRLMEFIQGADVVMLAVAGSDRRAQEMHGFGFITVSEAVRLCKEANISHLIPFHCFWPDEAKTVINALRRELPHCNVIDPAHEAVLDLQ